MSRPSFKIIAITLLALSSLPDPTILAIDRQALIQLGAQLFFDPRLSGNNKISCATCHKPGLAFTDGLPLAKGYNGKILRRNTPTLLYVVDLTFFFWDGKMTSLEQQALQPIQHPDEMNQNLDALLVKLNRIPGYVSQFQKIYGTPVTVRGIAEALSAFQRTLVAKGALFDKYAMGQTDAISPSAQRGLNLFQDKARCAFCHKGFNFTDSDFHNLGVPSVLGQPEDLGRFEVTGRPEDRGAFKTPTLRNVDQTAPYMHNGVFKTLGEVVEFYNKGGGRNPNLDIQMKPLNLTEREKNDLLEFLKTLTGKVAEMGSLKLP
jgi:cytochrome c peroxidase